MKPIAIATSLALSLFVARAIPANAADSPPNIVLIFADDLGYGDVGCYGATKVQTPNIDQLAKDGRRFTDAHSASAVCTPSRYGLLTGQYPSRKNIWGPAPVTSPLLINTDQLTIADVLKQSGYNTAAFGKWHLGFGKGTNQWKQPLRPGPNDLGFDYYFGVPLVNSCSPYLFVENDQVYGRVADDPLVFLGRNSGDQATPITPLKKEHGQRTPNFFGGATEAHQLYNDFELGTNLADRATQWISEQSDDPFFLYLSTTNIHHPFTPAVRFQGTSQCGLYGDFVHELDWIVGEVMKTLEEKGVADNTLVLFTSDNGGMFNHGGQEAFRMGHRGNGDLLGFKFGVWEGGQRVPLIARWPGHIAPGTTSDQLISSIDMLATFAALTNQTLNEDELADSINMLPALTGEPESPLRDTLIMCPHKPTHLAIRKGKWVFINAQGSGGFRGKPGTHGAGGPVCASFVGSINSDFENGKYHPDAPPAQLYDLHADVNQTRNRYDGHPEVVRELRQLLKTYAPPKPKPRAPKGKAVKPAKRTAATPSDRNTSFDFESGELEPWRVIEGQFGHPIGSRDLFFANQGEYNKQGKYYLTTLETSSGAERGSDPQTGVIVSPQFIPLAGSMTFRVGGGSGANTYIALCTEDGTELQTARGINNQTMQEVSWDLSPYAGQTLYLKVVDQATGGWGHITADHFQFDAEVPTPSQAQENVQSNGEVIVDNQTDETLSKFPDKTVTVTHSDLTGIGAEKNVMRRDPSDVIKVGDLYYVWYSKGKIAPGYDATVWYATSANGHHWIEQGEALAKGSDGNWDAASVFTPNVLVAEGRYWLFFTGTSKPFTKQYNPDSKIGVAVSESPDGPWQRDDNNPILTNSEDRKHFDSHLVDDACLIIRDGEYWLYYKGRQLGKSPAQTQMGLAIADRPQGPYLKHESNPVIPGNHEVLVWPQGDGVAAMIGTTGPKAIKNTIQYAKGGIHFHKTHDVQRGPWAGGAYRPEAFTQSRDGDIPKWGVEIGKAKGLLPFISRFDID